MDLSSRTMHSLSPSLLLVYPLQPSPSSFPLWLAIALALLGLALLVAVIILLLSRKQTTPTPTADKPPYLLLKNSERRFNIWPLPFTIGRGEGNTLIIDDSFLQWQTVSSEHACIVEQDQGYVIEDLGSQNKLRVGGHLTTQNLLRNGWGVNIGGVEFTYHNETGTGGAA